MSCSLKRLSVEAIKRSAGSTLPRFHASTLFFCALLLPAFVHAQSPLPVVNVTRSFSGQFLVSASGPVSPLAGLPTVATNADFVRLEPALLAVSAERVKESLWRELGIGSPACGRIYLALHPAKSLDENVVIYSGRFAGGWICRIELPDVLSRVRFARAMTAALLLEFASRNAELPDPAEIPAWLTDGLAQQLLAEDWREIILSSPAKTVNGLLLSRTVATQRGVDALAGARGVLRDDDALTFEQLSWPTAAQLDGADGGVYRASAQLFVQELLSLKNGPVTLRAMLQLLPRYYNWQTAFQGAFQKNFGAPLDVEKWWALRVVSFVARDTGPQWTPAVSRDRFNEILSVPVEYRAASNDLPAHAEISLQAVIRNFDSARQTAILQTKLRDLELSQLRLGTPFAALSGQYCRARRLSGRTQHRRPATLGQTSVVRAPEEKRRRNTEKTRRAGCPASGGGNGRPTGYRAKKLLSRARLRQRFWGLVI